MQCEGKKKQFMNDDNHKLDDDDDDGGKLTGFVLLVSVAKSYLGVRIRTTLFK